MKKNFALLVFLAVIVAALSFWVNKNLRNDRARAPRGDKLQVVASFYPLYYFASQIAGEKADVMNITPAAAEPHDYEPTPRDLVGIEDSDMLILNSGNFEAWGDKIKDELRGKGIVVVVAGDGLTNKDLEEGGQKITDPHIWLDPVLAKSEAENIEKGFIEIDPANTAYYSANALALKTKLDVLDREYASGLGSCKFGEIVTSHAAFGYLAARYHLNQVAISGVSPDEEPSSRVMASIVDLVREKGIKVIFFERLVSPKLSQTIADEIGVRTMVLDPLEGITDADLANGADYMTVMRENLKNLKTALQCGT